MATSWGREIQAQSKETFTFGKGCVYPILHYLEETKLVSSRRHEVNGRSRNYETIRGNARRQQLSQRFAAAADVRFVNDLNATPLPPFKDRLLSAKLKLSTITVIPDGQGDERSVCLAHEFAAFWVVTRVRAAAVRAERD